MYAKKYKPKLYLPGMEIEVYANIAINGGQIVNCLIEPTYILEYNTQSVRDFCNRMREKYLPAV